MEVAVWATSDRKSDLPPDWEDRRVPIFLRDSFACQLRYPGCTRHATEIDHIGSRSDHSPLNLRAVCSKCHSKRTARQGNDAKARLKALRKRPPERHPGTS